MMISARLGSPLIMAARSAAGSFIKSSKQGF